MARLLSYRNIGETKYSSVDKTPRSPTIEDVKSKKRVIFYNLFCKCKCCDSCDTESCESDIESVVKRHLESLQSETVCDDTSCKSYVEENFNQTPKYSYSDNSRNLYQQQKNKQNAEQAYESEAVTTFSDVDGHFSGKGFYNTLKTSCSANDIGSLTNDIANDIGNVSSSKMQRKRKISFCYFTRSFSENNDSNTIKYTSSPKTSSSPISKVVIPQINITDMGEDVSLTEAHSSPMLTTRVSKSATPSPIAPSSRRGTTSSAEWHSTDEDIDKMMTFHNRSSLSSLGVRSDSMASVYSGAGEGRYGTVTVKGQVEFGLQYNYKTSSLEILIKQCKDLAPVDIKRNRSDPYVKVYLLPDKSKSGKRKTKVRKHTLNPLFDECLKFHISLNELETRTLWLTVWHSDMFGRNDFLGEVMMTLENKVFDDPTPRFYNLQERTEPFDDVLSFKGDILVGLKFVPPDMTVIKKGKRSRGALHVLVKEAKSLTAVKANGTSDPFCKSYLLPEKGRNSKQKTSVIKRSINPVWNHTFIYDDVTLLELSERCLELTVWDHDRLASNEFLGGVRFSLGTGKHYGKPVDWMDATGKELSLWKSMLERPNFWVEGCLSLRPTLDHRTT